MLLLSLIALAPQAGAFDPGPNPLLMRHPTVNQTQIVFQFAGDLWRVPRSGGDATRLTSSPGTEAAPFFSPDGSMVAFTGQYDGNTDIYTVPAMGGVPKRLTYHPSGDAAVGWTPDGKSVIFSSGMLSNTQAPRLFTVGVNGGVPKPLPFPTGTMASMSPDGQQLAYVPGYKWQQAWKRYRGGQAYAIWVGNMSDSRVTEIPRKDWNDEQPMWVGDKVYYLSDPNGIVGLSAFDTNTKKVFEVIKGTGFDIKSADAGAGAIVYEKLGSIHLYDIETKQSVRVPINVRGDFPEVRPAFKDVRSNVTAANISPTGQRAVVAARGWIFTVPAAKGDARQIAEQQGVHRRNPAWSPDGKTISYFTDQGGKQQVALCDVSTGKEKLTDLGDTPAYYYGSGSSYWSPDSSKIAYTDNKNQLWILDVASGKNTLVDQTIYTDPNVSVDARWSPDSKWITWARDLDSHMQAVFVYNLDTAKKAQITDGLSHAQSPVFDRDGKHLYFFASTNAGPSLSWLDMSSMTNPVVLSNVYAVVLRKDLPNPLQPESDEEKVAAAPPVPPADPTKKPEPPKFGIDLEDIEYRIITLPLPAGDYQTLQAGPPGSFFAVMAGPRTNPLGGAPTSISKWTMGDRKNTPWGPGSNIITSADGTKALLASGGAMSIVSTMAPPAPGGTPIDISGLKVKIDPRAEWKSMFHEIWRNEPMLFYAANMHGIDPEEMRRRYEPFVANVASRSDLNYLFTDMLGEMVIGHMWAQGGDIPEGVGNVPGGLLGVDFSFENGRYKLTRVYDGERWNPGLYAPLAQPGVNAKAGEYLWSIDGKDLKDSNDIYEMLEGKAGKQVKVKIGVAEATAREVVVVPVPSEGNLRNRAWAEDNRRYVETKTGGRAGYVHVPDTGGGGWTSFIRYYYAQSNKDGIIVDERFNNGGLITDYIVYEMNKTLDAVFTPRTGKDWPTPGSTIYGPKVMIANQFAGSGGDMFPWLFKHKKLGPVVGKRTWGGLVASFGFSLVDGGRINSPNIAFYNPHTSKWEIEGHGVDPDIEVEFDPYLWRQGKDAQLEAAISEMNKRLATYKKIELKRPPYADKTKLGIRY
ncbi:MAG: PDZ domain-containing protein [Fimbriimonas sp.]